MEEAEALCNRLGIFVSGRLKTVGASAELKKKYGQFFKILITTPKGDEVCCSAPIHLCCMLMITFQN
jgi:ABC-type multidrug transport system ATPase subunit